MARGKFAKKRNRVKRAEVGLLLVEGWRSRGWHWLDEHWQIGKQLSLLSTKAAGVVCVIGSLRTVADGV
jgi:hypothetical protein